MVVIGVYFSPNRTLRQFSAFLDELGYILNKYRGGPVVLLGDLNARSLGWDVVTNSRGDLLAD